MKKVIAATLVASALAVVPAVASAHHIGTQLDARLVSGCAIVLEGTSSEDRETGSWIIEGTGDTADYPQVFGEYRVQDGQVVVEPSRIALTAGTFLLSWDQEPLGSWESSHNELAFSVSCNRYEIPEPRPTDLITPEPPDSGSGIGKNPPQVTNPDYPEIPLPPTDTEPVSPVPASRLMQPGDFFLILAGFIGLLVGLQGIANLSQRSGRRRDARRRNQARPWDR